MVDSRGTPVPDALVAAILQPSYRALHTSRTDADGRFSLPIDACPYRLTATARALIASTYDCQTAGDVVLTLSSDGDERRYSGRVVASDGTSVAGVRVRASRSMFKWIDVFYTETDSAGAFSLRLPAAGGGYSLMVEDPGWVSAPSLYEAAPESLVLRALARADVQAPAEPAVAEQLRRRCTALSEGHSTGYADVGQLLANAQIVGLGEATHGTHEFSRHRTAIIKELVTKFGFNLIALESPMNVTAAINDAVRSRNISVRDAVAMQGYWPFRTVEMAELVEWLRVENTRRRADDKIEFTGVDVDQPPNVAALIRRHARGGARRLHREIEAASRELEKYATWREVRKADTAALEALTRRLQALAGDVSRAASAGKSSYLSVLVRGADRLVRRARTQSYPDRDEFMAGVMIDLLEQTDRTRRIIYWAHDAHVAADVFLESRPAGLYLREKLGDAYRAVGSLLHEGQFRTLSVETMKMVVQRVDAPPPYFVEAAFGAAVPEGDCLASFSNLPPGALRNWLGAPRLRRHYGALEVGDYPWTPVHLGRVWDAVLFVRISTPSLDVETPGEPGRGPFPE